MPNYKEQYLRLFNHITDTIAGLELESAKLKIIQQQAEHALISEGGTESEWVE